MGRRDADDRDPKPLPDPMPVTKRGRRKRAVVVMTSTDTPAKSSKPRYGSETPPALITFREANRAFREHVLGCPACLAGILQMGRPSEGCRPGNELIAKVVHVQAQVTKAGAV